MDTAQIEAETQRYLERARRDLAAPSSNVANDIDIQAQRYIDQARQGKTSPAPTAPPQPKGNLLTGGVAIGWNELQGLSDFAIAAGAGAIGAKDTQQEYIKAGQEQFREAQQYVRPELELAPWQEGFKWSNLPAQIVYQSAKQIPMTAATLGAGGLVGQALKRAGIQALPKFAAGALSEAAEDIAGKKISAAAIQKAAQPVATTTAASYPLSVGSVYQEQVEKGDMSPGAAVTAGALAVPHALLESLEVGQLKNLFSRGMPSAATKKGLLEWMKGTAGAAAKATAGETVAEGAQAGIEQTVRTDLTPAQKADTILQSAFMGGIAGFGLGGGAHIIGSALSPTKNVRPDQLNDEALRTVVDTALNPQTAQQRLDAAVEASTDMRAPPAPERAEPTMSGLRQGPPGPGEVAIEISPEDRIRGGVEPAPTGAETLRQEVAPEQPAGTIDIPQPAQAPLSTARSTMPLPDAPLAHIENDQLQTMFERATDPQLKAQVRQEMEARLAPAQPATPTFEQTQQDARQELINTLGLTGQAAREAQKLDIKHPMEAFTLAQAQIAERAKKGRGLSPLLERINEQYGIVDESSNPLTVEDLQRVQAREQLVVDTAPNELVRENAQYRVDQIGRQLENRAAAEEYAAGATERAATQPTMELAAPEIPQAAEAAAADAGIKRAERRAFIKAFTDAATTTGGAPEEYLTKSAKAGFAAGQEYRARQAETPAAPVASAGTPSAPQTFTTAKGSTYTVRSDGTTIRNKAARPEHPGEEGIQPPSQKTVYMTESEMNKLAEIQAKGGARTTLTFDDATGTVAVKYLEGKDAGKIEKRTVAKFETQPRVGLSPLEFFGVNYTPHFGNKITTLEQPAATETPSAVQEQGPTGVYVQPAAETGGAVGERDTERREAAGARVEAAPEITERPTRPTSPVGEDVASMTTPPTPETGYGGRSQVDKQFTRLTEKMRRAYAYGTTLWNQVERFGKIVPALQNFWHATTQRDAFESQIADIAITPLDQFSQLVRKSRDAADRIQRIAKEARNGMDARKPWAAHTWLHKLPDAAEYKRRHDIIRTDLFNLQRGGQDRILTGLIDLNTTIRQLTNTIILHRYLTTQIKSDPTIAPAFAQRLARLSPITTFQESSATRDLASAATHFDQLYDKLYQLAKDYVQRYPDNLGSAELNKNIKELQRQHVEYRQAPYFHLGRSGDHGIKFKLSLTPDGLVDKAAANRVVKALVDANFDDFEISPLGTDPNVFLMVQHEDQRKDIAKILQGMVTTGEIQRDTLTDGPLVEGQKINNAPQIVQEIINRIAAADTDDPDVQQQNSQTMRVLSKFATDMLAENDARKSLIRRKNIEGFDKNIIGSMAEDIERRVRMLGRLAGTSDVYDALNAMRAQARQAQNPTSSDYKHRDQIATVAAQRQRLEYEIGMTTANPIVTFLTGVNYGATMGFRVATAVTQILQVPQLLVPVLMKQRGVGFVDAYKAVGRATSPAFEIMRAAIADAVENRTAQQWFDAPVSTKVIERANISDTLKRFMILYMNTHGAGNNSLARELGHLYNEHEVGGSWKTAVGTAQKMGTSLVYYAETFSRVLAALSAYEAYQGDKTSAEGLRKVRDYAGFVNADAMYSYSQSNVSQLMSRAGPMGQMAPMAGALLRFRTIFFEQFIRESARALGMDQYASPEQQQAARRFMTGYLSTTIILTGMLGLPFVNAMAPGWDRLMDELEPEKRPHDIRASFIQFIGDMMGTSFDDQTAAQITRTLIEGVPATAGVPLQSRIGAQDTFPFTDTVWDNPKPFKDKIWDALKTFFGIPTETLIDMADGVAKIANGDTEAGVKQIARSPAKDIIAVWRMMEDGKFRDAQGKVLPIEDATTQDIFQRLLGFSSTKEAEYQLERAAVDRREKPLQQEAARIVNAMALARQNNDWEKYEALAEQAREYRDRTGENLIKRAETLYKRRRTELREAERSGLPLRAPKKDQPLRELMSGYTGLRENP